LTVGDIQQRHQTLRIKLYSASGLMRGAGAAIDDRPNRRVYRALCQAGVFVMANINTSGSFNRHVPTVKVPERWGLGIIVMLVIAAIGSLAWIAFLAWGIFQLVALAIG
jgi:hypothetical protein